MGYIIPLTSEFVLGCHGYHNGVNFTKAGVHQRFKADMGAMLETVDVAIDASYDWVDYKPTKPCVPIDTGPKTLTPGSNTDICGNPVLMETVDGPQEFTNQITITLQNGTDIVGDIQEGSTVCDLFDGKGYNYHQEFTIHSKVMDGGVFEDNTIIINYIFNDGNYNNITAQITPQVMLGPLGPEL